MEKNVNSKLDVLKTIAADVKVMVVPVVVSIFLMIAWIVTINVSFKQIKSRITKLNESDSVIALLDNKLNLLRRVEERVLSAADVSLLAVPSTNPVIWSYLQINQLIEENGIDVSVISIGQLTGANGYSTRDFGYKVSGDLDSLENLIDQLQQLAPIMTVPSYDISSTKLQEYFVANIQVQVSNAPLPKQLPAISAPIKNLNERENEILTVLEALEKPEFTTLDPQEDSDREDPFN